MYLPHPWFSVREKVFGKSYSLENIIRESIFRGRPIFIQFIPVVAGRRHLGSDLPPELFGLGVAHPLLHLLPVGALATKVKRRIESTRVKFWLESDLVTHSQHTTGRFICPRTWVGLTSVWVFQHLAQLHSHFCQIPTSPGRIGQTVEHPKSKSIQPRS